ISPRTVPRETTATRPRPEATLALPPNANPPREPDLSVAAIVQSLIRASLATYPGNCPCLLLERRSCGPAMWREKRLFATRRPISALLPYDIMPEMVEDYRKHH